MKKIEQNKINQKQIPKTFIPNALKIIKINVSLKFVKYYVIACA